MMKKLVLVLLGCFIATGAFAETKGFQLSLIPDVAIQAKTTHIKGVSLSIWGEINRWDSLVIVCSPLTAAKATLDLNAGE